MDDDDDFGEFGGFESADAAFPVVDELPAASVEAGPSPWAILDTNLSSVGMRPDLLCGQNRFPPVLDPTVPRQSDNSETSQNIPSSLPVDNIDSVQSQNESILVNDILDGSFHKTSESSSLNSQPDRESSPSVDSRSSRSIPDLSLTSHNARHTENTDQVPSLSGQSVFPENPYQPDNISSSLSEKVKNGGGLNIVEVEMPNHTDHSGEHTIPTMQSVVQAHHSEDHSKSIMPSLMQGLPIKTAAKDESFSSIQKESSDAVKLVVQEYKTLMNSSLKHHQDTVEQLLQKNNTEQQLKVDMAISQQQHDVQSALKEIKQTLKDEMAQEMEDRLLKYKEEFKELFEREMQENTEKLESALQKEREKISDLVQNAVSQEHERGQQQLLEQKTHFLQLIEQERKESALQTKELLEAEKRLFMDSLKDRLEEERKCNKEAMDQVIALANEEMKIYLQQQKQMNKLLLQRQHTSLDIFLESARQQLKLVMDRDEDCGSYDLNNTVDSEHLHNTSTSASTTESLLNGAMSDIPKT